MGHGSQKMTHCQLCKPVNVSAGGQSPAALRGTRRYMTKSSAAITHDDRIRLRTLT